MMLDSSVSSTSTNWLAERYWTLTHATPPPPPPPHTQTHTHTHTHTLAHKSYRAGMHWSLFPSKRIKVIWRQRRRRCYCRWHKASVRPFRWKVRRMVSGTMTRVWGDDEENLPAHIGREFGKTSCGRTNCAAFLWLASRLVVMQKHAYVAWSVRVRYYSEYTSYTCLHVKPPQVALIITYQFAKERCVNACVVHIT